MNETPHARAQKLFAQSLIEGLPQADQNWLNAHLDECAECAQETATTRELLGALRSVPVAVPSDLAERTQLKVRLRAQQSAADSSPSNALLWTITAASWLLGISTAPLVWRGFAWLGAEFRLPKLALQFGFVLWWMVPALVAVAIVLHQRAERGGFARRKGN